MARWHGASLLILWGCAVPQDAEEPPFVVFPPSGPSTGYFEVALTPTGWRLPPVQDVEVHVGDVSAIDLDVADGVLTFLVQGSPEPQTASIRVTAGGVEHVLADGITYRGPADPHFDRVVAFGASLTQGVQDGVPTAHGGLHNPALQVARQLGAYFPVPVLKEGLIPSLQISDIGPPPGCVIPEAGDLALADIGSIVDGLVDPDTGVFGFHNARMDPFIEVHNVAVGGTDLADMVDGPDGLDLKFLSHLVYDPFGAVGDPLPSQLEVVEQLQPTLVLATDAYGNDLVPAILGSDGIDPDDATPPEELFPAMESLVDRLAATGAQVFVANLPRPSLLPLAASKRADAVSAAVAEAENQGADPKAAGIAAAQQVDLALADVDDRTVAANDHLATVAEGHANVHVVDLFIPIDDLFDVGLDLGSDRITSGRWGGFVTLDGLHFTDTGYAAVANVFLDTIDAVLGTQTGRVDLQAVVAADPRSPSAIAEGGFDTDLCHDGAR